MGILVVRNINDEVIKALKTLAGKHGISAEAEHRKILEAALLVPKKKTFAEILAAIPNVGQDADFERKQGDGATNVFD